MGFLALSFWRKRKTFQSHSHGIFIMEKRISGEKHWGCVSITALSYGRRRFVESRDKEGPRALPAQIQQCSVPVPRLPWHAGVIASEGVLFAEGSLSCDRRLCKQRLLGADTVLEWCSASPLCLQPAASSTAEASGFASCWLGFCKVFVVQFFYNLHFLPSVVAIPLSWR